MLLERLLRKQNHFAQQSSLWQKIRNISISVCRSNFDKIPFLFGLEGSYDEDAEKQAKLQTPSSQDSKPDPAPKLDMDDKSPEYQATM